MAHTLFFGEVHGNEIKTSPKTRTKSMLSYEAGHVMLFFPG